MLLLGGNEEMTYKRSDISEFHKDSIGILPNGQTCSPVFDKTIPNPDKFCKNCVGVAYASRKGRWIYRCGGKNNNDECKNGVNQNKETHICLYFSN